MNCPILKQMIDEHSCGCRTTYSLVEVEPDKYTVIANPEFCEYHNKKYWDEKIRAEKEENNEPRRITE